jgi:membrane protein YdbS with pleckstrin-like domain
MSYVDSQLLPNETVLYRARLHRSLYAAFFGFGALTLAAAALAMFQPPFWWAVIVLGVISLLAFVSAWIRSTSSEFAVTDKRVIIKVGWIRRRTLETMLGKVEGVGVDQTLSGRMLGFGTITVTGTGGTKEEFDRIADPLEFRRQVQAAISAADQARGGVVLPPGADAAVDRQERECPFCAERILVKAKVCRFCGRDVSAGATA